MKAAGKCMGAVLALGGFAGGAQAIDLTGIGYVTFGDGKSYSMPVANWQVTGNLNPPGGGPFTIDSSPGKIQDLVVIATGTNNNPVTTNFAGMDDAFHTPSSGGGNFFSTGTFADPNGAGNFTGDLDGTWDATVAALSGFLAGEQMVFFFNNNQTNSGGSHDQSLAFWAQAWITGPGGGVFDPDGPQGPQSGYYEFTNRMSPFQLTAEGGGGVPLGDPGAFTSAGRTSPSAGNGNTDYVLSGGQDCLATSLGGALVDCASPLADVGPVNHNLGANNAAYAAVVPELNAVMDGLISGVLRPAGGALDQYVLHLDIRMGCDPTLYGTDPDAVLCSGGGTTWNKNLNNGYEQIFIGQLARAPIPEPASASLLAAVLAAGGAGAAARRRRPRV